MSMPEFPQIDPELTCEHALNMILTSIAMEELALSHIINAEGEKLQYVLGTLETSGGRRPSLEEVLAVNKSVTCLMDSVSQNEMILKSKMDKALSALENMCHIKPPCPPRPPCPPYPPCPPGPPGPIGPPGPPCKCPCKCSAHLRILGKSRQWCAGSALGWEKSYFQGGCFTFDHCDRTKLNLPSKGHFVVSFIVNVKARSRCRCHAVIGLQMIGDHHCADVYSVCSPIPASDTTVTISMSEVYIDMSDYHELSSLRLKLMSDDDLIVEDARLSIMEI